MLTPLKNTCCGKCGLPEMHNVAHECGATWEDREREAFHQRSQNEFWSLSLGEEEIIADYWIERIKSVREKKQSEVIEYVAKGARSQALEEVRELLEKQKTNLPRDSWNEWEQGEFQAINRILALLSELHGK